MKKEPLGGEILTDVTDTEHTCIEASTLDNALVMIVVLEENGRIISWNHAAGTITGHSQEEVVGSGTIWKHLYPDPQYRHSVTEKIPGVILRHSYFENLKTTVGQKIRKNRSYPGTPDRSNSLEKFSNRNRTGYYRTAQGRGKPGCVYDGDDLTIETSGGNYQ